MDIRLIPLLCLVSVLLPSVQPTTSNKSRKVQYEYFDDYLLSITAQDAKHKNHNRVPKPDSDHVQPEPSSNPALDSTSDDEDLVQASGDGGVKDVHQPSTTERRHRPHRHPVQQDSEEKTQDQERPKHHPHLYIPESLPKEERERLEEEEQEEEDEEEIRAEEERREEDEDTEKDKESTHDLDILGYFKDVPREHWSCCMLGKLAGDKGFHCHAGFYAARITTRNPNRAHNQKMLWHGRDSVPTWGLNIMRTFQRCVARHAAEFHKCCFAATIEKRERSKWEHYRSQHHLVDEKQTSEEAEEEQQQSEQTTEHQREGLNTRSNRRPAKISRRVVETEVSKARRRQEKTENAQNMDNQQMRLEEQDRRVRARRRRPHNRRRQQS